MTEGLVLILAGVACVTFWLWIAFRERRRPLPPLPAWTPDYDPMRPIVGCIHHLHERDANCVHCDWVYLTVENIRLHQENSALRMALGEYEETPDPEGPGVDASVVPPDAVE